jgi:hypothetical protein
MRASPRQAARPHTNSQVIFMEAERSNAIINGLNDLNRRVDELRGYL